jgi:hypothetical protein
MGLRIHGGRAGQGTALATYEGRFFNPRRPYGHRQPQAQIQEAIGEVFCSHFLHAGQCRVHMWSAVTVVTRACTTDLGGGAIRCLAGRYVEVKG